MSTNLNNLIALGSKTQFKRSNLFVNTTKYAEGINTICKSRFVELMTKKTKENNNIIILIPIFYLFESLYYKRHNG